jgi:two-component system chemotaxis response regulator CheB
MRIVVVGTSWGGADALAALLKTLPADFDQPVAVVQHRAPTVHEGVFARYLSGCCALPVTEVDDKDPIVGGSVALAPADYHLLVEPGWYSLSLEAPVRYSRPSIDVLFESAAAACGAGVTSVVLTGTGADGALGTQAVAAAGGTTVAQDPAEAAAPEMPERAIATGAVQYVLPIDQMADLLTGARR